MEASIRLIQGPRSPLDGLTRMDAPGMAFTGEGTPGQMELLGEREVLPLAEGLALLPRLEAMGPVRSDGGRSSLRRVAEALLRAAGPPPGAPRDAETLLGPRLWDLLRPFQRSAVQFALDRGGRAYIADEMGAGKTLESLATAWCYRDLWPLVVVCPAVVRWSWKAEILKWLGPEGVEEKEILLVEKGKDLETKKWEKRFPLDGDRPRVAVMSYKMASTQGAMDRFRTGHGVLLLDEAHYTKTLSAQRTQACLKLAKHAAVRLLLSGTPCDRASELYAQLKFLEPDLFPRFFDKGAAERGAGEVACFARRYCRPRELFLGGKRVWEHRGFERAEELGAVLSVLMVRRRKRDILRQLPPKVRSVVTLPPLPPRAAAQVQKLLEKGDEERKRLDEAEEARLQWLEGGGEGEAPRPAAKAVDTYMRAFRLTCEHKILSVTDALKNLLLPQLLKGGKKVLIFAFHKLMQEACLEAVREVCGDRTFSLTSSTPTSERAELQRVFQEEDRYDVGVLSLMAACTGLTLTRASAVVFAEILFSPAIALQAEDRVHRIGQEADKVFLFYMLAPQSTDDVNFGLIRKKERESSTVLDGGRTSYLGAKRIREDEDQSDALLELLEEEEPVEN